MNRLSLLKSALCALLVVPLMSCDLIDVTGDEGANTGRGAVRHDPYASLASGSVRLSLQYFNGCAVLPNGQMAAKNSTPIPYPDLCATPLSPVNPLGTMSPPTGTLKLLTNTQYFLNQFTVTDTLTDVHKNAKDLSEALNWIRSQSWMKKLDWGNVGASPEEWSFIGAVPGITQDSWAREVHFRNANWQKVTGDSFTVEFLDRGATVRASAVYARDELLISSSYSGHSRASWRVENIQAPLYPGDLEPVAIPTKPASFPQPITYRTIARLDLVGSTNPFKTITTPSEPGEGAVKVTWSQMPNDPFYFPVTFVRREDLPATCTDEAGAAKQCAFGLDPRLSMSPPSSGSFYKAGRDDQGEGGLP